MSRLICMATVPAKVMLELLKEGYGKPAATSQPSNATTAATRNASR